LQACAWNATTDAVLDWLKHAPALPARTLDALERALRRQALGQWAAVAGHDWATQPSLAACVATVEEWREALRPPRPLVQWLAAARGLLEASGQWTPLAEDAAGARVLMALRLQPGQEAELDSWSGAGRRMAHAEFLRW